jgi:hypothetical protein
MRGVLLSLLLVFSLLVGCSDEPVTAPPVTCEQAFAADLERGVSYTVALGDLTQCLIERGDIIELALRLLELLLDRWEVTVWLPNYFSTNHPWCFSRG